jgi:hypothetical protein
LTPAEIALDPERGVYHISGHILQGLLQLSDGSLERADGPLPEIIARPECADEQQEHTEKFHHSGPSLSATFL